MKTGLLSKGPWRASKCGVRRSLGGECIGVSCIGGTHRAFAEGRAVAGRARRQYKRPRVRRRAERRVRTGEHIKALEAGRKLDSRC